MPVLIFHPVTRFLITVETQIHDETSIPSNTGPLTSLIDEMQVERGRPFYDSLTPGCCAGMIPT